MADYQATRNKQGANLAVDGICGPNTWRDLLGMEGSTITLKAIQAGDQGVEVLLLQEVLKAFEYYQGALDRSFGLGTRAGLILLQ